MREKTKGETAEVTHCVLPRIAHSLTPYAHSFHSCLVPVGTLDVENSSGYLDVQGSDGDGGYLNVTGDMEAFAEPDDCGSTGADRQ